MFKKTLILCLLLTLPVILYGEEPPPIIGPDSPMPPVINPVPLMNLDPTDDYVGVIYELGTTWYDYQHNGSTSRQIALDGLGNVHIVWMNALASGASQRHIYYNFYDVGVAFPDGIQISVYRSGYTTLDVNLDNIPVAFFHSTVDSSRAVCGWDFIYGAGAFLTTTVPLPIPPRGMVWPHGVVDNQGYYHAVMQTNPNTSMYYTRSEDSGANFLAPIDMINVGMAAVSQTMAASPVSNKIAIGYTHPLTTSWIDEDVFYIESDDGVTWNFINPVNITNFGQPGHPMTNEVRAWTTVNMIYDHNDNLHIAYTSIKNQATLTGESILWHWSEATGHTKIAGELEFAGPYSYNDPGAWHSCWDLPCMGVDDSNVLYCSWEQCTSPGDESSGGYGNWEVYVSYSEDAGESWMAPVNITNTHTPSGAPGQCMSEGWPTMSKSVDDYLHIEYIQDRDAGGIVQTEGTWTENPVIYQRVPVADILTDITVELTPVNPPIVIPVGGGSFNFNITITNNSDNDVVCDANTDVYIYAVSRTKPVLNRPLISIPGTGSISRDLTQFIPGFAPAGNYDYLAYVGDYGWSVWAGDSFPFDKAADGDGEVYVNGWKCTGWGDDEIEIEIPALIPESFSTLTVSPNPFNPSAEINFTIAERTQVKLSVFDITGREVAILVNGFENAGTHKVTFNSGNLASGVYFFTLQSNGEVKTVKSLLLK